MLRFLTHKLRSQSLNEEQQFQNKAHDDHDSGTESDDESGDPNDFSGDQNDMEHEEEWDENRQGLFHSLGSMNSISGGGVPGGRDSVSSEMFESGYNIDSALPSDSDHAYDHHSSEEELEVINNTSYDEVDDDVILGPEEAGSLLGDEDEPSDGLILRNSSENKRKWSQVASNRLSVESTSSSDDEVQGLLRPLSTPVEFCTSPPVDAHKPSRSQSPPPKLFLFSSTAVPGGGGANGVVGVEIQEIGSAGGGRTVCSASSPVSSLSSSSGPGALMNGSGNGVFRGLRRNDHHNNPYPIMSSSVSSTTPSYNSETHPHSFIINNVIPNNSGSINNSTCGGPVVLHSELLPSSTTNHHHHPNTTSTIIINNSLSPTTSTAGAHNNVVSSSTAAATLTAAANNLTSSSNSSSSTVSSSSSYGNGRSARSSSGREITRRRHRHHHNPRHIQRPWLDFEKMQQVQGTGSRYEAKRLLREIRQLTSLPIS